MHLRKLAWAVPLLLAVSTAHADNSGSFLDGARQASMTHTASFTPVSNDSQDTSGDVDAMTSDSAALAAADTPEQGGTPEVRGPLTLVVALAMVGWIQRRRQDA